MFLLKTFNDFSAQSQKGIKHQNLLSITPGGWNKNVQAQNSLSEPVAGTSLQSEFDEYQISL